MPKKLNKPRVLGVLAGQDFPSQRLAEWTASADIVVAADGGANLLAMIGVTPSAIIGDMDSVRAQSAGSGVELIHIPDQESSDCDKLLGYVQGLGIGSITLTCTEGDQLDHVLGTIFSCARSHLEIRLLLRRGVGHILHGPIEIKYSAPPGARLSLMPITDCSGVSMQGTEWQLNKAVLSPVGLTSLSNRVVADVEIRLEVGSAVLILSHPELEAPHW